MAVEVLPNPDKGMMMPVHQFCLAECGVYLIENLALEEMAAARIYAACFILLATKIRGATGAPVRPGRDGLTGRGAVAPATDAAPSRRTRAMNVYAACKDRSRQGRNHVCA